jgi:hypothetical protein
MKYAAPRAKGGFETCFFADGLLYEATTAVLIEAVAIHLCGNVDVFRKGTL